MKPLKREDLRKTIPKTDRKIVQRANLALIILQFILQFILIHPRLRSHLRHRSTNQFGRHSGKDFRAYHTPFSDLKQELYHCFP